MNNESFKYYHLLWLNPDSKPTEEEIVDDIVDKQATEFEKQIGALSEEYDLVSYVDWGSFKEDIRNHVITLRDEYHVEQQLESRDKDYE